jgi:hypothetical protein
MVYLITQFDIDDLDQELLQKQGTQINDKLLEEGCRLLMHSDQLEFAVYSLPEEIAVEMKNICGTFAKYCAQIVQIDFQFDLFTWEEIESSGHFPEDFIEAVKQAEGKQKMN